MFNLYSEVKLAQRLQLNSGLKNNQGNTNSFQRYLFARPWSTGKPDPKTGLHKLIYLILSTYWSSSHLISYLLVRWRKILGEASAESNIFLQLTDKYDIRCEEDQ